MINTPAVKAEDLHRIPTLGELSPEHLERLARVMIRRVYAPGQLIFLEGDLTVGVWFVIDGHVRITKQSVSGRVQGLCMVSAGTCFGGCPLFDGVRNPASAEAVETVSLLILPQDSIQQLVTKEPGLALTLLQLLSSRLSHLARLIESLGVWTVGNRINDSLLAYSDESVSPPQVRLTHEKLAVMAGTVREVVSRHLARLEKQGIIRVEPGRIVLLEADLLGIPCINRPTE